MRDMISGRKKPSFHQKKIQPAPRSSKLTGRSSKKRLSGIHKTVLGIFVFSFLLVGAFSYRIVTVGKDVLENKDRASIIQQIKQLVVPDEQKLQGEEENRINILLIGLGGESHRKAGGMYLTDTIMVASIRPEDKSVSLISIPRDLYVSVPGFWSAKINSAYSMAYTQNNDEFEGSQKTVEIVENVLGIPIHYYIRLDFDGFRDAIDALGGIDVYVQNNFTDYQYPTYTLGYQTVTFKKGLTKMDGETALKYSRSRYAVGVEGGDFARAKRQQIVLEAVKEKAFSADTFLDPKRINLLLDAFGKHVGTNLEMWEISRLIEMAKDYESDSVINRVLDTSPQGLLTYSRGLSGQSILIPRDGLNDFKSIHEFADNIFDLQYIKNEQATLEIYNGTRNQNFAQRISTDLEQKEYDVVVIANAPRNNFEKTVIYDQTNGKKPYSLRALVRAFDANVSTVDVSTSLEENTQTENPTKNDKRTTGPASSSQQDVRGDFVIVLGSDYYQLYINGNKNQQSSDFQSLKRKIENED